MTAQTLTLAGFLAARIKEDEEAVRGVRAPWWWENTALDPARVLAECEAKRRIVEHCEVDHLVASPGDPYVLQLLALPYADHSDWREEWRA